MFRSAIVCEKAKCNELRAMKLRKTVSLAVRIIFAYLEIERGDVTISLRQQTRVLKMKKLFNRCRNEFL